MSNFKCPHCGITNIDCGKDGYKTPREIELEKELEEVSRIRDDNFVNYYILRKKIKEIKKLAEENIIKNDVFDDYEKLGRSDMAKNILKVIGAENENT